jgi:hypothetical protein
MPILRAQIQTERASRYLVQFCKHAAAMGNGSHGPRMHLQGRMARPEVQVTADWSDTFATVAFTPWGRCTLGADAGTLTLRIDAADQDGLIQIRDIITRDLRRFSSRDPLTMTWQEPETPGAAPSSAATAVTPEPLRRHRRPAVQTALLTLAVVLAIGVHIGLLGTVVANSPWTSAASNLVVAAVVAKVALIAWVRYRRRRKSANTSSLLNGQ